MEALPVKFIDCKKIRPLPGQPRKHFDPTKLAELEESIRENGQEQVARVRPLTKDERAKDATHEYELVFGERRWRACTKLGIKLRCEIETRKNENERRVAAVLENESRESLSPYERALAYTDLKARLGLTEQDLAKKLGLGHFTVNRFLRLGRLPKEVLELMHPARPHREQLRMQVALELYKWDPAVQRKVAPYVIGMSFTEAEPIISSGTRGAIPKERCNSRKPSDIWKMLESHAIRTQKGNKRVLELGRQDIADYVARTPLPKIDDLRAEISEAAKGLQALDALLASLTARRRT